MVSVRVDSGTLTTGGTRLTGMAASAAGDAEAVANSLFRLGNASADPGVLVAASGAARKWGAALALCAAGVSAVGAGVSNAGFSYQNAETANARLFGEHR